MNGVNSFVDIFEISFEFKSTLRYSSTLSNDDKTNYVKQKVVSHRKVILSRLINNEGNVLKGFPVC